MASPPMGIRLSECGYPTTRMYALLYFKTVSTIATYILYKKLDYYIYLFLNIDITQINRLRAIQNALVRAVINPCKHHRITSVLETLHWLKIPARIEQHLQHTTILPAILPPSVVRDPTTSFNLFPSHPNTTPPVRHFITKSCQSHHNHCCLVSLQ